MRSLVLVTAAAVSLLACAAHADTVTGKVLGPDNKPVSGAKVYLSHSEGSPKYEYTVDKVLTTDATGTFTVDLPNRNTTPVNGVPGPKAYGFATVFAPGLGFDQVYLKEGANEFHLAKSVAVTGKVVDTAGKPVAKATVRVVYFQPLMAKEETVFNRRFFNTSVGKEVTALFTTTTGADGAFTVENLPVGGIGGIEVVDDDYARNTLPVTVGDGRAVTLTVRPTAILTGKVVDESGKPVARINLFAAGMNLYGNADTGDDGTFTMKHLGSGTVMVRVTDPTKAKVAAAKENVSLTEGKTTTLPNFVLTDGGFIEATILDADTGNPVPNMAIVVYGPQFPKSQFSGGGGEPTGPDGKVRLRVMPGENSTFINSWQTDYPNAGAKEQTVTVKAGETMPVTFKVKKGAIFEGTVVGEDDRPISGVHIRVLSEWQNWDYEANPGPPTDATGKFRSAGVPRDGQRLKIFVDNAYDVVSPATVELDAARAEQKPIVVKLKKSERRLAQGRIVTPDGSPIPGVNINVYSYTKDANGNYVGGGNNKNVQTDANGVFQTNTIKPKETVQANPSAQGFRYLSGGEVTDTPQAVRFSDIVMTPLNVVVSGQVVDTKGKPVAGALVWSAGSSPPPHVTTDAMGKFTLSNLPADGVVRVAAGKGKLTALSEMTMRRGKPETGSLTGIILTLEASAPADTAAMVNSLIESVRKASTGNNREWSLRELVRSVARRDPDRALAIAQKDGRLKDEDRFAAIESLCQVDPAGAAVWGPPQCEKFTNAEWKCAAEGELAITLAGTQPERAGQLYDLAVGHLQESDSKDPYNAARLIAAAALLRRPDGDKLMERLNELKPDDWAKGGLAATMARGDRERAIAYVETLPDASKPYAYDQLLASLVRVNAQDTAALLDKVKKTVAMDDYSQSLEFMRAARKVVQAVGKTDPQAALQIARGLPKSQIAQVNIQRAFALAEAAAALKGEASRPVWNDAVSEMEKADPYNKISSLAALASFCRVMGGPADVAQDIWKRARASVDGQPFLNADEGAVYHAGQFEPPFARMLAQEIIDRNANTPPNSRNSYPVAGAGVALVTTDPQAALETIDRAPDDRDNTDGPDSTRFGQRIRLIQLLLLTPQQRSRLLYEDLQRGSGDWERDLY